MATPENTKCAESDISGKTMVSFAHKPSVRLLQRIIPIVARIAPRLTAERCLSLFLTPGRKARPSWETIHLKGSRLERVPIGSKQVSMYRWGVGRQKVLLCHAWGGRGTQLGDFVSPLVQSGFEVVAFDAPGHGDSDGVETDMVEYAKVIADIARALGPLRAIVGHSFGAGNAVYANHRYGINADRMALVGCFSDGEWVINRFAELLNIPEKTLSRMKSIHERRHDSGISWKESFRISELAAQCAIPTLIVHDKDDFEIPYSHAEALVEAGQGKHRLITTSKLGHRKIVRDASVIRSVCEFIAR